MMTSFEKQLETDLQWREGELAVFREMLSNQSLGETRSRTMFRAAWAMLYAHYEGYVKFCLDSYLDAVSKKCATSQSLSEKMFVLAYDKDIKAAKSLSSLGIYRFFLTDLGQKRNAKPSFPATDTRSNLWPELLKSILDDMDIALHEITPDERKIKTLVSRRNDIAHGKQVFISDLAYYLEYEELVLGLMYELTLVVSGRFAALDDAATIA